MTTNDIAVSIAESVGTKLRQLREDCDLKQTELATRLQVIGMTKGSSAKTISAWERGETPLPLTALPYLAVAFKMDRGILAQKLGICGDGSIRETVITEYADALIQIEGQSPEVAEGILHMLRSTVAIMAGRRVVHRN